MSEKTVHSIRYDFGAYNVMEHHNFGKRIVAVLKPITEEIADNIRGEIPDVDGTPVLYIGDSGAKNYYQSHDLSELQDGVIEIAEENGLKIITGVDGGWSSWEGRPEWSETYIDFTDSTIVNDKVTA